jgi:ketosteroid isomerase-like protein
LIDYPASSLKGGSMPSLADTPAKLPVRAAMEAHDLDAAVAAFASDAVVRSPFTSRFAFEGHEQIRAILEVAIAAFGELRYTAEVRDGDRAVLVACARVGGRELEFVDHMLLDEHGKIREFTVFFRPLPAATAALRYFGAGLARRRSAARAGLVSVLARPLALMAAAGDRIGARIVGPTL